MENSTQMKYSVNPVKGTLEFCKERNCDIQKYNDHCFNVCSAFNHSKGQYRDAVPFPNNWRIPKDCENRCNAFMEENRIKSFGVNSCDHQTPWRPVAWGQVPHHFPNLLKINGGDSITPELAYEMCVNLCDENQECKDACRLDYLSIERDTPPPSPSPQPRPPFDPQDGENNLWLYIFLIIGFTIIISVYRRN